MRVCTACQCSIEQKHKLAKFCGKLCKDNYWKSNNWDKVLASASKYRKNSSYRKDNKDKINLQIKQWKLNNPDRKRELNRNYHKSKQGDSEYLAKRRHHEAMRRARKLQATPKWLTNKQIEEIKQIYKNCPKDCHVDHIMPLKGNYLSGLHVPWNLQYLPGIVNKMKSNKVDNGNSN